MIERAAATPPLASSLWVPTMDNSSRALVVWTAAAAEILAFLLPSWLPRMDVVLLTESRPLAWRRRRSLGYLLRINWAVRLFIAQCYRSEHGPSLLFGVVTQLQAPAASRPHDTGIWCLRVLLHRTAAPTALPAQGPLAWETATRIQSQWERLGTSYCCEPTAPVGAALPSMRRHGSLWQWTLMARG